MVKFCYNEDMRDKIIIILKISIVLSIVALIALVYFQQGDFTSIDLGRHLEYGKLVFSQPEVLYKNVFSYTEPDFPNINHHWFSGVIFWFLYSIGGFKILSLLNILLGIAAILIMLKLAVKKSSIYLAGLLALPVIIILSERVDIRPEMFSNLLIALVFYILDDFRSSKSVKKLFWLLPIFFIWVNLHIYFFIGLFMVALALFEQLIIERRNFFKADHAKKLLYYFISAASLCLLNPNFIKGFAFPFKVMSLYYKYQDNYEIVENKSPLYLEDLMINHNILIFKVLFFLLLLSFVLYYIKKIKLERGQIFKKEFLAKINYFYLFIVIFFSFFAFKYIRNLPVFGLIALPIMAGNFYYIGGFLKEKLLRYGLAALIAIFFIYSSVFAWLIYDNHNARYVLNKNLGLGINQNSLASENFFKGDNLKGPIFNNFDIGSALDFWLYPGERVFVDNRPDTFSRDFFKKIYIPMQNDQAKWEELSAQYKINLIYFTHTDGTPWAQEFLASRLRDNDWPLVYFDDYTLIMLKNNETNKGIIEKYKIEKEGFESRLNELLLTAAENEKLNLAGLAQIYGRRDLAENIYQAILAKRPGDGKILAALGFLLAGGNSREAVLQSINYFNKALDNGYKLPGVYNQLGLNYWNLADYSEAKNMWRKSLRLDSDNEHAKYYLDQANSLIK